MKETNETKENTAVVEEFAFYYVTLDGDVLGHFNRENVGIEVNLNTGGVSPYGQQLLDCIAARYACTGNWDAVSVYAVLNDDREILVRSITRDLVEQLQKELCVDKDTLETFSFDFVDENSESIEKLARVQVVAPRTPDGLFNLTALYPILQREIVRRNPNSLWSSVHVDLCGHDGESKACLCVFTKLPVDDYLPTIHTRLAKVIHMDATELGGHLAVNKDALIPYRFTFDNCDSRLIIRSTDAVTDDDLEDFLIRAAHDAGGNWSEVTITNNRTKFDKTFSREEVEAYIEQLPENQKEKVPMKKKDYYSFQDILKWLGFGYRFENHERGDYPFTRKPEDVKFGWGQVVIPKTGIRQIVQNKVSDIKELPIQSIKMDYTIPFTVPRGDDFGLGVVHQDLELTFRYDKEWKYGDITKSIYEVCFWILMNAKETNNFFIIEDDAIQGFMSECVINNQWGIGSTHADGCVTETLEVDASK